MKVITVDWSGDANVRGQYDHIWAATVEDGQLTDLSNGRTRGGVTDYLISVTAPSDGLVVGIDFAFSFPAWFLHRHGFEQVGQMWDLVAREGEHWLSRCEPPFWGRPGTTRPDLPGHLRATDTACQPVAGITPKSVFQIGGAGAVGTGSIRGMPYLRNLRDAGFGIWPFDPPGLKTVVEVYPRALTGPVKKSDRVSRQLYLDGWDLPDDLRRHAVESEDAFDAAISALVMSRHAEELAALTATDHPDGRLEGSIWVPAAPLRFPAPTQSPARTRMTVTPAGLRREIDSILADLEAIESRLARVRTQAEALRRAADSSGTEEPEAI